MQRVPMMTVRPIAPGTDLPRTGSVLAGAMVLVPLLCFVVNLVALVAYGIDLPYMDDWRAYQRGEAGSLEIGHLFLPANDTLYPVGIFFDSMAQRLFSGNSVAYQLLSLALVLGSLLFLQWRLLGSVLRDRLLAACAFSATLFMLQPGSYWGLQDMAYHQAVPLVLVLFALHVVLVNRWHAWLSPALLVASGAVAGMIYISGAFAILATGVALLLAALLLRGQAGPQLKRGGFWLTLIGVATSIPQLWVIVVFQKGTHRPDAPMAYPSDADFWFYLLGKIGRSLMLPTARPAVSLAIVVLACVAVVLAIAWSMHASRNKTGAPDNAGQELALATPVSQAFVILFALCAVVGIYLAMVSAGRTNLRPDAMGLLDIYSFAFHRFHFFWVTLLWPWLFAVLLLALQRGRPALARPAGIVIALAVIAFTLHAGVFSHRAYYASTADLRVAGIKCIRERIEQSRPILCESLLPVDLSPAIRYAEKIDASFSRILEFTNVTTLPIKPDGNVPLVVGEGDELSGRFGSPHAGNLTAIGLFVGNFGGLADGDATLEVCAAGTCATASQKIAGSVDNDFLVFALAEPLRVAVNEELTFSISVSGSSHPMAAWLYPSVDGSVQITGLRRGVTEAPVPNGQTVRLALHYLASQDGAPPAGP